jgi:hypothetical protein
MCLGQFTGSGSVQAFYKILPIMQGYTPYLPFAFAEELIAMQVWALQ